MNRTTQPPKDPRRKKGSEADQREERNHEWDGGADRLENASPDDSRSDEKVIVNEQRQDRIVNEQQQDGIINTSDREPL